MSEQTNQDEFPEPATVYGLYSTRDGRIRYVGQTTGLPEWRYGRHKQDAKKGRQTAVANWMRVEMALGHQVEMHILDEAGTLNETEQEFIAVMREAGYDLLNVRKGGGSPTGDKPSKALTDVQRTKIAEAAKARPKMSDDVRAKIGSGVSATRRRQRRGRGQAASVADNPGMGVARCGHRWQQRP